MTDRTHIINRWPRAGYVPPAAKREPLFPTAYAASAYGISLDNGARDGTCTECGFVVCAPTCWTIAPQRAVLLLRDGWTLGAMYNDHPEYQHDSGWLVFYGGDGCGWRVRFDYNPRRDPSVPDYHDDLAAAMARVEKLAADGVQP